MREPQKVAEFVVPDAQYIRRELPVSEVAVKLGLDVHGRWVRCPHDRAHWARIWMRKNKLKCFSCPCRPMTTIDLAMHILQADVNQAIQWIAARFDVPTRRRRITRNLWGVTRHLYVDYPARKRPRHLELSIDTLRRSPLWAHLTPTARRLAAFLIQATPRDSLILTVTYRELQGSVQTGNRGTLKRAFDQLRQIGFAQTSIEATERDIFGRFAGRTVIRLTWGSQRLQSLLTTEESATKYIGSKLNQVKSQNRQETEPGATPQESTTSAQGNEGLSTGMDWAGWKELVKASGRPKEEAISVAYGLYQAEASRDGEGHAMSLGQFRGKLEGEEL